MSTKIFDAWRINSTDIGELVKLGNEIREVQKKSFVLDVRSFPASPLGRAEHPAGEQEDPQHRAGAGLALRGGRRGTQTCICINRRERRSQVRFNVRVDAVFHDDGCRQKFCRTASAGGGAETEDFTDNGA